MINILSITSVFPTPEEPGRGIFIRNRLQAVGELAEVFVIAPVARIDYGHPKKRFSPPVPAGERIDGNLRVLYRPWLPIPFGGALNVFALALPSLRAAKRIAARFDFGVIDSHFGHPEAATAALLAAFTGRPFVVTLRGSEVVHARYPLRRWCMAWALRRSACVIAVSERLRQFALSLGVDASKAVTIPNGVDTGVFHFRNPATVRRELGIEAESKLIVTAGHLVPEKGQHRIIDAVDALRRRGMQVGLAIAGVAGRGHGRYEQEIKTQLLRLGLTDHVRFFGQLASERLAELMCAADVFCLASSREGWPNVVHEAMACGTPVVCTDVGAAAEMIESPANGIVVPIADQPALINALERALNTTWNRTAISAHGGARTWRQVAREVMAQLERLRVSENRSAAVHEVGQAS